MVVLNLLMQIGISRSRSVEFSPGTGTIEMVTRFMEEQGGTWGMRREVAMNAAETVCECLFSIGHLGVTSPVQVTARFDELTLNVVLRYHGPALTLATTPPSPEELVSDPMALSRLSGFLIQQAADKVSVSSVNQSAHIRLHFEH